MTSRPRCLAEAATSDPIQPAPTTTTLPPRSSRSRSAVGVLDAAQVEHAVQLRAGDREPSRLGAGGQQQAVVAQPLAVVEGQLARRRVQAHRRSAEAQLDVVPGVEALVVDVDLLAADLATQVLLGQRRALVGPLVLGPDQHHAPVEALVAQGLGRLRAGQARADDHERLVTGHGMSSESRPSGSRGALVVSPARVPRRVRVSRSCGVSGERARSLTDRGPGRSDRRRRRNPSTLDRAAPGWGPKRMVEASIVRHGERTDSEEVDVESDHGRARAATDDGQQLDDEFPTLLLVTLASVLAAVGGIVAISLVPTTSMLLVAELVVLLGVVAVTVTIGRQLDDEDGRMPRHDAAAPVLVMTERERNTKRRDDDDARRAA